MMLKIGNNDAEDKKKWSWRSEINHVEDKK